MDPLKPWKVTIELEALLIGYVRNDCLNYMTKSQNYISIDRQKAWWKAFEGKAFLYSPIDSNELIGFGILNKNGSLSGGLVESYRDKGLGKFLFGHLKSLQPHTWLEVFATNERAYKLYYKLGYKLTGRRYDLNDRLIYIMEAQNDTPT